MTTEYKTNHHTTKSQSNIVTLENFEELNDNFVLRSPNKGKIYRGPNWNAFNRQSLGTIPRKSENILFQEKNSDTKKGFMSQVERFEDFSKKDTIKYSFPGPGKYSNEILDKTVSTNVSLSSKGYGNGFVSKSERFDDPKDYYEKFYPGPGQYVKDNDRSTISHSLNKSNCRYKSLYNTKPANSLKVNKDLPGPGHYNPIIPLLLNKELIADKNNFYFASKNDRFKGGMHSRENNTLMGPGRYFANNDMQLKDPDKTSFFFKRELSKNEDPIEKFLNIPKVQKFKIPGPGEYNLRKELIDENKFNYNINRKPLIDETEKTIEKNETELEHHIKLNKNLKNDINSSNDYSPSRNEKGIKSIFQSKSPKGTNLNNKHVPGPSYYNPNLWPKRISYNCNNDKYWI